MRVSFLAVSAALALALVSPAWAQSSDTPPQAAPSTPRVPGDEALSPSTLPKARQSVKEGGMKEGTNSVDALSPDEQRRLDRIRAKAAAKEAAKADAAKAKAAKIEADKAEAAKREAAKADAAKAEDARREAAKAEAEKREAARQAAAKADETRREGAKADAERRETARQAAMKAEAEKREAARQDAAKAEAARQAAARVAAAKAEAAKADAAKTAEIKTEAMKAEAMKAVEAARAPPVDARVPNPRKDVATKSPRPSRHSTRQAARRAPAPDSAALDQGRPRRPRMVPPVWHEGPGPEYAERAPRVGDTVPPGVPLYDLPPRYGAHYPPYPRGDDDYPPPRRFYGEGW